MAIPTHVLEHAVTTPNLAAVDALAAAARNDGLVGLANELRTLRDRIAHGDAAAADAARQRAASLLNGRGVPAPTPRPPEGIVCPPAQARLAPPPKAPTQSAAGTMHLRATYRWAPVLDDVVSRSPEAIEQLDELRERISAAIDALAAEDPQAEITELWAAGPEIGSGDGAADAASLTPTKASAPRRRTIFRVAPPARTYTVAEIPALGASVKAFTDALVSAKREQRHVDIEFAFTGRIVADTQDRATDRPGAAAPEPHAPPLPPAPTRAPAAFPPAAGLPKMPPPLPKRSNDGGFPAEPAGPPERRPRDSDVGPIEITEADLLNDPESWTRAS